jgi:DNA-binding transcriptional ArsR family regulator
LSKLYHWTTVFSSLSDGTRRDILRRLINQELSIGEIAKPYDITFAAVSKHLKVLEKAQLIIKRRRGKEQIVQLSPQALKNAAEYLENYQLLWDERFQNLDKLLKQMQEE